MRPALIKLAPVSLKTAVYYRFYRDKRDQWPELYEAASLHYAPAIKMRLSPTDEGHGNIAFTGFYELDLTKRLIEKAKQGGLLVDVGANYGYYSLLWASQHPKNRVIAFEASPRNREAIVRNIADNHLNDSISLRSEAVGQEHGILPFSLGPADQTGWGGISQGHGEGEVVNVPVVRLDEALGVETPIEVLKIDIEGADAWALMGAESLLREKCIKNIYYEENKERMKLLGIKAGEAKTYLRSVGYQVDALGNEDADLVEYYASPK